MKNPLIKICGITSEEEIGYIAKAGINYAGFVLFFKKSKRNLSLERAEKLIAKLPADIASVAVTVSPTKEQVEVVVDAGFSAIQIHGKVEDSVITSCQIPVLKAFNVSDMDAFSHYEQMDQVTGFVMDAAVPGSGKTFDWDLLQKLPSTEKQVLLAGGLNPDNVGEALAACAGKIDGVDTSSGVERTDGNGKSKERIEAFVRAVWGRSEK
ncbi:MAG: phosphoribosylanthranilate isomerase [Clostridium sp.]|nr:phosphoribosylanthranilate isomerase [Clostridium sp.]MCI7503189.1 phosphoribosylanthranilate isomerase [Clostridium sp.]MDY4876512.1 phosphoribosylanthranilate isomerase [Eubacterium sp.]